MDVSFGGVFNTSVNVTARSLPLAAKLKSWTILSGVEPSKTSLVHAYMGAIGPGIAFRYDIGPINSKQAFLKALVNVPGALQVSNVKINEFHGIKQTVAKMTPIQNLVWNTTLLGNRVRYAEDVMFCTLNYSLLGGTNCLSWTVEASLLAVFISKLKF